jgi:hypothetical protein
MSLMGTGPPSSPPDNRCADDHMIAQAAILDAQYLRVERRFRGLFDEIRGKDWTKLPTFEIGLKTAPQSSLECARQLVNFHLRQQATFVRGAFQAFLRAKINNVGKRSRTLPSGCEGKAPAISASYRSRKILR